MARFSLRHLEYACAVARHGGIAQAARVLNISQPSVAQGLEKLEAVTGLVLFERHHARGLTPTAQGRQFLGPAESLLAHAAKVERHAAALVAYEAGTLRLGCFTTIAAFYLPGLIRSFNEAHPGIIISAEEATLDVLPTRVRDGDLDICLAYDIGEGLDGLEVSTLAAIAPTILLPAAHPSAGRASISLRDLAGEAYVMYDAPGSRDYFDKLLREAGLAPEIAYASQSLEGVRSAVGAGFGFSIAALRPRGERTYEGENITAIPIEGRKRDLRIVAATRPAGPPNHLATLFISHATRRFAAGTGPEGPF